MNHTPDDIPATVKALGRLTVLELKQRYAEVFGEPQNMKSYSILLRYSVLRAPIGSARISPLIK